MKTFLFILVSFMALTATFSGLVMIADPTGEVMNLPVSLLKSTPFKNYLLPGILLTIFVGFVNLAAVITNIKRSYSRYNWALAGGFFMCGWIMAQVILIRSLHWLHFFYFVVGMLVILIAFQLKGKWAA
ncbi:MAG TPA: hypothetical protein VFN30_07685 [Chitinophagaceae bacterium]|nr:hypothetical protein [Chitinophagaceae bacterium]